MLTPQDIKEKTFEKATFGGYDMSLVDDFLEQLTEDYAMLYKENAVLKNKLKVLVEKVEEYRSTEDSMRMALLTAQKMGKELVEEARAKGETILAEVNESAQKRSAELKREIELEEARLGAAQRQTEAFSQKVLDLITEENDFIRRLGEFAPAAPAEPKISPAPSISPTLSPAPSPAVSLPAPPLRRETEATPPLAKQEEAVTEGAESPMGSYLAQEVSRMITEEADAAEPSFFTEEPPGSELVSPPKKESKKQREEDFLALFDQDQFDVEKEQPEKEKEAEKETEKEAEKAPIKRDAKAQKETIDIARSISASLGDPEELKVDAESFWDDETEPTTKRPKFNFDDLQFGDNFYPEDK